MNKKFKSIIMKATKNKANGQINFSFPKKKVSKEFLKKLDTNKSMKFLFEDE